MSRAGAYGCLVVFGGDASAMKLLWLVLMVWSGLGAREVVMTSDPTPEDVFNLSLVNRLRMEPASEGRRWRMPYAPLFGGTSHPIDVALYAKEMAALVPVGPVLWDTRLANAARCHARWMAKNAVTGHNETPGSPLFTGITPNERMVAAGFPYSGGTGENVTGPAFGPWNVQAGYIIDWDNAKNRAAHGMQDGRPHRVNMCSESWTRIGIGFAPVGDAGRQMMAQNYGCLLKEIRRVGGVVFNDRSADGLPQPGEGMSGVVVSLLDAKERELTRCETSASGHWVQDLPAGAEWLKVKEVTVSLSATAMTQWFLSPQVSSERAKLHAPILKGLEGSPSPDLLYQAWLLPDLPGWKKMEVRFRALNPDPIALQTRLEDLLAAGDYNTLRREIEAVRVPALSAFLAQWKILAKTQEEQAQIVSAAIEGRPMEVRRVQRHRDLLDRWAGIDHPFLRCRIEILAEGFSAMKTR